MLQRGNHEGAAVNKDADTPISVSPMHAIGVGTVLIVRAVSDNSGSSPEHTVTDSVGNEYQKLAESSGGGSAAGAGVVVSTWLCNVANEIGPSDTVTLSCATGVAAKGVGLETFTVESGKKAALAAIGEVNGTGSSFAVSLGGLSESQRLHLMALGIESHHNDGISQQDANWGGIIPAIIGTSEGGPKSNATCCFAWRFGDDTAISYNGNLSGSFDWAAHLIALDEVSST